MQHRVSFIGLGVMGQRMLASMAPHERFNAVTAWDPDEPARRATAELYPQIRIAPDARDAIADPDTAVVYIACPPAWHREVADDAINAGKAVYCEKPLGVDLADGRAMVEHARGSVNIVNFSLASAPAVTEVEQRLAAGTIGNLTGIDVRVHFSEWPRAWQVGAAGWLDRREQGGFTREVLSHWVYLAARLAGPVVLTGAAVRYPRDERSERQVVALLEAGTVPVSIAGSVGGIGPDRVECTVWGTRQSCRIHDWNRLRSSSGDAWQDELSDIDDPRQLGYRLQLDNAAAAIAGEANSMPTFQDALAVQEVVEGILSARP